MADPASFPFAKTRRQLNSVRGFAVGADVSITRVAIREKDDSGDRASKSDPWLVLERLKSVAKAANKAKRTYHKELRAFKKANRK